MPELAGPQAAHQRIVGPSAVLFTFASPGSQIGQRAGIPPDRHHASLLPLGTFGSDPQMRPRYADDDIADPQRRNLRHTQAAATSQSKDHSVHAVTNGSWRPIAEIIEDQSEFTSGEDLEGIDGPG